MHHFFAYVARLRYHEMTYECEGKTRKACRLKLIPE